MSGNLFQVELVKISLLIRFIAKFDHYTKQFSCRGRQNKSGLLEVS